MKNKERDESLLRDMATPLADQQLKTQFPNIYDMILPNSIAYSIYIMDIDEAIYLKEKDKDEEQNEEAKEKIKHEISQFKSFKTAFNNKVNELLQICLKYENESSLNEEEKKSISRMLQLSGFNHIKCKNKNDIITISRYKECMDNAILYCRMNGMSLEERGLVDPDELIMSYIGIDSKDRERFKSLLGDTDIEYYRLATSLIEFEHEKLYVNRNIEIIEDLIKNGQEYLFRAGMLNPNDDLCAKNPYSYLTDLDHVLCGSKGAKWNNSYISATESFPVMASYLYATANSGAIQRTNLRSQAMAIDLKKLLAILKQVQQNQREVGQAIGGFDYEHGYVLNGEIEFLKQFSIKLKQHGIDNLPEPLKSKIEEVEIIDDIADYRLYTTDDSIPTDMICYASKDTKSIFRKRTAIVESKRDIRVSNGSIRRIRNTSKRDKKGNMSETEPLHHITGNGISSAELLFQHAIPNSCIREISMLECDFIQSTNLWTYYNTDFMNELLNKPCVIDNIVKDLIKDGIIELEPEELKFLKEYYFENKSIDDVTKEYINENNSNASDKKRTYECLMRRVLSKKIFDTNSFKDRLINELVGTNKEQIIEEALNNPEASIFIKKLGVDKRLVIKSLVEDNTKYLYISGRTYSEQGKIMRELINLLRESNESFNKCRRIQGLRCDPNLILPAKVSKRRDGNMETKEELLFKDKPSSANTDRRATILFCTAKKAAETLRATFQAFNEGTRKGISKIFGLDDGSMDK